MREQQASAPRSILFLTLGPIDYAVGYRPLKAEDRVRTPVGLRSKSMEGTEQWCSSGLENRGAVTRRGSIPLPSSWGRNLCDKRRTG